MIMFFCWLLTFIGILISMPFFTLYERKILSYMQKRKGPNKVSFLGLLQPVSDGIKLIIKESSFPLNSKFMLFWMSSFFSFILMVFGWILFPFYFKKYMMNLSVMVFVCISSLKVYSLLGSGWGSKSKYSLLGSIRGSSQVMSYEVSLIFSILFPLILFYSLNFILFYNKFFSIIFLSFLLFFVWLLILLAETNRAPFDFAEGESELVSGFKTEYSSLGFAFLFLGEYGSILLISVISMIFFLFFKWFFIWVFGLLVATVVIWCRGSFPRFRYDFLMKMAWKFLLPITLFFIFFLFFKF